MQEADPDSLLALTRRLLALRRAHPALRSGIVRMLHADDAILAIERREGDGRLVCVFNLSREPRRWVPHAPGGWRPLLAGGPVDDWSLGPYAALVAQGQAQGQAGG